MQIQWYPGHMYKASKQIRQALPKVDLVIEVLDARIPFSSENPMIGTLRDNKPCIKILNKSDLADPELTKQWQAHLEQEQGVKTLALSNKQPEKIRLITDLCRKMLPARDNSIHTIHAMIMGIPNVGKSTLINILAGKTIAKTGNEPAVTKGQQRINLGNGIELSDTPGVLWANIENKHAGYRLAITGAIKDTAMEYVDVAFYAANYLLQTYPNELQTRYQLNSVPNSEIELLEIIGKTRGCLRAGGKVDLDKVSKILLNELRTGTIGKISLETPQMAAKELLELVVLREQKAAKNLARSQAKKSRRKSE